MNNGTTQQMDAVANERTNVGDRARGGQQAATWSTITPELATEMLRSRGGNFRDINHRRVMRIAEIIQAVGWRHDGNSIKINTKGEVIDGQHRLAAIARLGITVQGWIVTGVSDYDAQTEGTDMPKTFGQYLKKQGHKRYLALASAVRYVWLWERGYIERHGTQYTANTAELIMTLGRHSALIDSAHKAEAARLFCSVPHLSALHYVLSLKGLSTDADRFVELVASGVGLAENDPINRFRERMAMARAKGERLTTTERLAMLITAWNYWLTGREIQRLRWVGVGPMAQPFPDIAYSREASK